MIDPRNVVKTMLDRTLALAPEFDVPLQQLYALGPVYLCGGAIRAALLGLEPGDLDLAADIRPEALAEVLSQLAIRKLVSRTRFGGYRLALPLLQIDLWPLTKTVRIDPSHDWYAPKYPATPLGLAQSFQLNLDTACIDAPACEIFHDGGMLDGIAQKRIEVLNIQDDPVILHMGLYRLLRMAWQLKPLGFALGPSAVAYLDDFYPKSGYAKMLIVRNQSKKAARPPEDALVWPPAAHPPEGTTLRRAVGEPGERKALENKCT